jgi:hypothetical protein
MATIHWNGYAIFADVSERDAWLAKFRDLLDGMLDLVEAPDAEYPEGLTITNNRVGNILTGPAFTWSMDLPDTEWTFGKRAYELNQDLSNLPETVAESGSSSQ